MGATSLGGGVVGYLRTGLVVRQRWLDDITFVELLSISQTLPGLNATNMSILVGDRLRGARAPLLATLGMCLPGAALMTAAAFAYGIGGDDPWSKAFLHGIAAGAVGLIVVVMVQLGAKVLKTLADYVFVLGDRRRRCRLRRAGALRPAGRRRHRHLVAPSARPEEGRSTRTPSEAARRHRWRLRLSLAAHRGRRHGGLPRAQDADGRRLSLGDLLRAAALLQPGPALARPQHDDGGVDRRGGGGRARCRRGARSPSSCRPGS